MTLPENGSRPFVICPAKFNVRIQLEKKFLSLGPQRILFLHLRIVIATKNISFKTNFGFSGCLLFFPNLNDLLLLAILIISFYGWLVIFHFSLGLKTLLVALRDTERKWGFFVFIQLMRLCLSLQS